MTFASGATQRLNNSSCFASDFLRSERHLVLSHMPPVLHHQCCSRGYMSPGREHVSNRVFGELTMLSPICSRHIEHQYDLQVESMRLRCQLL